MTIELLDPAAVTDAEVAALHECAATCLRALRPDEPTPPAGYFAHRLRNPGEARPHRFFVAWDATRTRVLGYVEAVWYDGSYSYLVETDLNVRPDARRRGIGRALIDTVSDAARAAGRRSVVGSAPFDGGGVEFAKAVGAHFGLDEYRSRLFLHEANTQARPVDGFSLVRIAGPCPDEYAESFTRMLEVMNTAPQGGDITWPDDVWDVERLRRVEADRERARVQAYSVAARDDATNRLVALTMIGLAEEWPAHAEQWDTATDPAYRGRGLARWVKMDAAAWLRDERPDVEVVSTWNAASNDSMLSVNVALGYRDRERWVEAELDV